MVLATKVLLFTAAAVGLAVPLTTTIGHQSPQHPGSKSVSPVVGRWERHFLCEPLWKEYYELRADGTFKYFNEPDHTASGTWRSAPNGIELTVAQENGNRVRGGTKVTLTNGPETGMLTLETMRHYCKRSHPHAEPAQTTTTASLTASKPAPTRPLKPSSQSERDLLARLHRSSYQSPDGTFVVDADPENHLIVTINETSQKAGPIEKKVAAYLAKYGITDVAARRTNNRIWFLYEGAD
jgi:hypothetical protein